MINLNEHDFQNQIRLELTKLGWITFRVNVGKVKMFDGRWFDTGLPRGFTDLILFKDGKTIFIEVKTETGKVSKYQENFIKTMSKNGFITGVVRNMEDVLKLIKEA